MPYEDDDEDDRPLGSKPYLSEEEDLMDVDEDLSLDGDSSRRKRRVPVSDEPAKRHRLEFDDDPPRGTYGQRDEQLFEDARTMRSLSDKRLERAVANITLDMLESVRLKLERLLHMLEHPKFEEYIRGAYVRYPDLEKIQSDNIAPERVTDFLPAQITKCVHLDEPEKVVIDDRLISMTYELTILQYTSRADGSLKIRKGRLDLAHVQTDPFRAEELDRWRELLRLFSGRAGSDKLQTLPEMLSTTAERLRAFTFTTEDVAAILKRKHDGKFGWAASLNWRDLYLRKSELEFELQDLKDDGANEDDVNTTAADRIDTINQELEEINKRLATLRKEEEANNGRAPASAATGAPRLAESLRTPGLTPRLRTKIPGLETQMLTPRFLQAKGLGGDATPTRSLDWTMLDSYKKFNRPCWVTGQFKIDSHLPTHSFECIDDWKRQRKTLIADLAAKLPEVIPSISIKPVVQKHMLKFPFAPPVTGEVLSVEDFLQSVSAENG